MREVTEIFEALGATVQAVPPVVGALVVAWISFWFGLRTWRHQLIKKTEHDVARRYLRSALCVREAVVVLRRPVLLLVRAGEQAETPPQSAELEVYLERWKEVEAAWSDLCLENLEAEVLWGKEVESWVKPLRDCVNKLRTTLDNWANHLDGRRYIPDDDIRGFTGQLRGSGEKDDFAKRLETAVERLEEQLRPKLRVALRLRTKKGRRKDKGNEMADPD